MRASSAPRLSRGGPSSEAPRSPDAPATRPAERANGPACTPGSVRGREPRGRSSLSATRCRAAPAAYPGTRRAASSSPVWPCSGRGLPCGSCHHDPGGLLHHPFTLTGTEVPAVCSLWHCLADRSGWVLPTALPCGARTFLGAQRRTARDATVQPTHSQNRVLASEARGHCSQPAGLALPACGRARLAKYLNVVSTLRILMQLGLPLGVRIRVQAIWGGLTMRAQFFHVRVCDRGHCSFCVDVRSPASAGRRRLPRRHRPRPRYTPDAAERPDPRGLDCGGRVRRRCAVDQLRRSTLIDPSGAGDRHRTVRLVLTNGSKTDRVALGELVDERLSGRVLWPGASVDAAGQPTGWPGWAFVDRSMGRDGRQLRVDSRPHHRDSRGEPVARRPAVLSARRRRMRRSSGTPSSSSSSSLSSLPVDWGSSVATLPVSARGRDARDRRASRCFWCFAAGAADA